MLEKSCQWWLIWYLLFFCHGGGEGQLQWVVKEKVTAYGQNLISFCPVENCCSEPAGWFVGHKSIILDVKAFSNDPSVKYHGTYNTDGFGVVIRNLSEADLNVTYRCAYGFDQSTPKHLLHGDVFKENVPDKDKEIDTTAAIVVAIVVTVVVIALIIIGIVAYCVCRSKRPSIHITSTDTDVVEGQSHTITCSISSTLPITDITWIKTSATGNKIVIVVGEDGKFSGGTMSDPSLTINNIAKSDEGTYVCNAKHRFGTASSEDSVITCKGTNEKMEVVYNSNNQMENQRDEVDEPSVTDPLLPTTPVDSIPRQSSECIEVEIIQKGPISVGHGGTIRINAKIISNSTGSLKVNWQKTHGNCSTALRINRLKYSGSSCNMNNPELVINNFNKDDAGIYKLEVTSATETISSPGILLELFGDEADSLSKEGNNFFRLYVLCQKIATQAVRDFFDSNVPGLESFLKQHKSDLTSINSVYRCTKEQRAILFPGGQVAVDSADFDFTLLYKLIRNLLTAIPAPTCGWGNPPLPEHLNETDDIERIQHLRNILAHNSKFEIYETDFSADWTDLSQAIKILSNGSLSTDVESMRTKKLDKCIINEMEKDIRKELKEIQQKIHSIDTRHIPFHIKKSHIELIQNWRLEDKLFYDETRGFTAALKMVQSEHYMTIIGGPGSGKTATAHHIALQLEEQGWEVVPVCRLEEIITYGDRDHKQVFVLDDVLGIFGVDMNLYNYISNHENNIFTAIKKTSKLLFTCRKSVYKEAFELGLFVTENVIDLQSKDNQLTETEKMVICKYHCENKDVSPDLYASLSFTKANHMFPYLCRVFSREEKYQQLGENFFNKPFKYFISELGKLQHTNPIQYAVLVSCLINDSNLSIECLPHERMEEVFNNCRVNRGTSDKQIKDAIYHMSETYFTKLDTEYTFTHDFIFEAIAYHYGSENQQQILKYLSSSYIANKVTVYEQASNEDLCIHISEDMYLPLAERLFTDIQSMNLFDVFMNKSLKHGPFRDVFEGMLKRKPFDEFQSLILRKHELEIIHHFVQKTLSVEKQIKKLSDFTEYWRVIMLFDTVFQESDTEHSVRVISWIINYGHTHLLQEIVNHVKYNNHNISLIFGFDVVENTRLLLLGCFSNTLDMVELILKYVDPKCIDMNLMSCVAPSYMDVNIHRQYMPLTTACEIGNLCIVKALLRNNAEVNKCNYLKDSPLSVAITHGHMDIARCLLSSGANINLCNKQGNSPLFIASKSGYCDIVKYLVAHNVDVNLTDIYNRSPLYSAAKNGHDDTVLFLLQNGADVNISDIKNKSPLYVASSSGHYNIVNLLIAHGALSAGNTKAHEEEKEAIYIQKVQKGKENTTFTGEQEEIEEIIYTRETKEENKEIEEIIYSRETKKENRRNEQIKKKEQPFFSMSFGGDALLPNVDNMSPLSIAVQERQFVTVKNIIENSTDFDLSDTGKSPLFLAAENGDHDIVALLLHSKYNDITKTYLETTPLEIAVWRNNTEVVQLLIQEENKLQKYRGNYHLFEILTDLKRSEVCINEQTGKEDCQTQDRNHRHLPYPLWHILTASNYYYLTHLLKIGLDINKRDYNGNTLFYKILNRTCWMFVYEFKCLMEHFEDVNVGGTKWISLLETKRRQVRHLEYIDKLIPNVTSNTVPICNETLSEFRKHVRRNSI